MWRPIYLASLGVEGGIKADSLQLFSLGHQQVNSLVAQAGYQGASYRLLGNC
ncbi:MAG: hypothetical protein ACOYM4_16435 [Nodosilinea sp.]